MAVVGTSPQLTSVIEKATMRYASSATMARLQRIRPLGTTIVRLGSFGIDPDRRAVEQVWSTLVRCSPATRGAYVSALLETPSVVEPARQVDVPIIVVRGAHDRVLAERRAAELVAAVRQGAYVEVPGAGHMLPVERPAAVADAVQP
jgi:pimeloyl-ACP methyl ester carboxylesterase